MKVAIQANMMTEQNEQQPALRLFTAISVPREIKEPLAELMKRLQAGSVFTGAHPVWVRPEDAHVTLVFLGWQAEDTIGRVKRAMASAVLNQPPFVLSLGGLNLFPSPRSPRVICLNIRRDKDALACLYQRLTDACAAEGFTVDSRAFHSHLTLARIKSMRGIAGLRDLVKAHVSWSSKSFTVDRVTLYKSDLHPDGARYEVVAEEILAGNSGG